MKDVLPYNLSGDDPFQGDPSDTGVGWGGGLPPIVLTVKNDVLLLESDVLKMTSVEGD